jgi:CheY-like chemotaxis protein
MEDGGILSFRTSTVELEAEDLKDADTAVPGTYICLAVTDTGQGIPEHLLDHVLEPFFTTKEIGKGTGLGLSMVYGFVQQSEGHFVLSSKLGQGSTFNMYFPMVGSSDVRQNDETAASAEEGAEGDLEHILVVEDNPEIEKVISRALSKIGYDVHSVQNGPEAVAYLEDSPKKLDLLLTDMVLPDGLSGMDIARKLRQVRPDTKIIFMTGYSDVSTNDDDEAIQRAPLLNKPFKLGELTSAIRAELG